jgi:uncharacterized protein with HEPN domain
VKSREPALFLDHILERIDLARSYLAGVDFDAFRGDQRLQDAVVRRIADQLRSQD